MKRIFTIKMLVATGALLLTVGCSKNEPLLSQDESTQPKVPLSRQIIPYSSTPKICGPQFIFTSEIAKFRVICYDDYTDNTGISGHFEWEIVDFCGDHNHNIPENSHYHGWVSSDDGLEFSLYALDNYQCSLLLYYVPIAQTSRIMVDSLPLYASDNSADCPINKIAVIKQPGGGWKVLPQYTTYWDISLNVRCVSEDPDYFQYESVTLSNNEYMLEPKYFYDYFEYLPGDCPQFSRFPYDPKYRYKLIYLNENEGDDVHWGECGNLYMNDGSCRCPYMQLAFFDFSYNGDVNSEEYDRLVRTFAEKIYSDTLNVDYHYVKSFDEMLALIKSTPRDDNQPVRLTKYRNRTTEFEYGLWQNDPAMEEIWQKLSPSFTFETVRYGEDWLVYN